MIQFKRILCVLLLIFSLGLTAQTRNTPDIIKSGGTIKILHIMSFHSPWIWTDYQFDSFKAELKDIKVDYKVIKMDAKTNNKETLEKIAKEAIDLINTWKPDLVYGTDDAAQQYVTIKFINSPIPFVYSGVNKYAEFYGFSNSKNIIGVQEIEHYVPSIRLLQKIVPKVKKIAIISDDDDANWIDFYTRVNEKTARELPDIKIVATHKFKTYKEYQDKLLEYNKTKAVDAYVYIGWFKFKDEKGENVSQDVVARWTAENSKIPEISFWLDRINKGNLCTVAVSGNEQGSAAGKFARSILVDGKSPSSVMSDVTFKGDAIISMARAKKLGVTIPVSLLKAAQVIQKFEWE